MQLSMPLLGRYRPNALDMYCEQSGIGATAGLAGGITNQEPDHEDQSEDSCQDRAKIDEAGQNSQGARQGVPLLGTSVLALVQALLANSPCGWRENSWSRR